MGRLYFYFFFFFPFPIELFFHFSSSNDHRTSHVGTAACKPCDLLVVGYRTFASVVVGILLITRQFDTEERSDLRLAINGHCYRIPPQVGATQMIDMKTELADTSEARQYWLNVPRASEVCMLHIKLCWDEQTKQRTTCLLSRLVARCSGFPVIESWMEDDPMQCTNSSTGATTECSETLITSRKNAIMGTQCSTKKINHRNFDAKCKPFSTPNSLLVTCFERPETCFV